MPGSFSTAFAAISAGGSNLLFSANSAAIVSSDKLIDFPRHLAPAVIHSAITKLRDGKRREVVARKRSRGEIAGVLIGERGETALANEDLISDATSCYTAQAKDGSAV